MMLVVGMVDGECLDAEGVKSKEVGARGRARVVMEGRGASGQEGWMSEKRGRITKIGRY